MFWYWCSIKHIITDDEDGEQVCNEGVNSGVKRNEGLWEV